MTDSSHAAPTEPQSRTRRARTDLARAMILAAVLSLVLIGGFNAFNAWGFLGDEAEGLLIDAGSTRGTRIERGLERLVSDAKALSADASVGQALETMAGAFSETTDVLSEAEVAELEAFYQDSVVGTDLPGSSESIGADVLPRSDRTQYLQYWYIAANPNEDRSALIDPGDGSVYSLAHSLIHPTIQRLLDQRAFSDLLLISRDGDIVYSSSKRVDFGTNILRGPFSTSSLGTAITDLGSSAAGQVRLVDFAPYAPAGGAAELWAITLVRSGDEVVGAIAAAIPSSVLTEITTGSQGWEDDGLGETGEVYVVGADGTLRSEPRRWLEDPDAYLDDLASAGYTDELIEDIRRFGTTVLLQPIDTEPVRAAAAGETFTGTTRSYLNQRTLSASGPLQPASLGWVVVSEAEQRELASAFVSYGVVLLVAVLIVSVIVTIIAFRASARLLRPIGPIVAAAKDVEQANLNVKLFDEGRDEFAYLSGQLNDFVDELSDIREEAEATEAEATELLASVVPRRLIQRVMDGGGDIAETLADATLIAMRISGDVGLSEDDDLASQQSALTAGASKIGRQFGVEPLASTATTVLYAAGLDAPGRMVEDGVAFAATVEDWIDSVLREEGFELTAAFGIASGDVLTGVVGGDRLAVDVLGTPREIAFDLSEAARSGQILADADTAARLGPVWRVERIDGLQTISGTPLDGWSVVRKS